MRSRRRLDGARMKYPDFSMEKTISTCCGDDPREPVDQHWDDEGVIPEELTPDTTYLFARMREKTLEAVDIRPTEMVLDIGCGQGLDLISQKSRDAKLFGLDGSLVMIRKASENFLCNGLPSNLICGSAEQLPFSNQSFHKVYCKGAIDHFYDPEGALREMFRVLRPKGCLVVSVANFGSLTCRLGRLYSSLLQRLKSRKIPARQFWDIPRDHKFKFDHPFLIGLLPSNVSPNLDQGISLFWGLPFWGKLLGAIPTTTANAFLGVLDRVARLMPSLADVILIRVRCLPHSGNNADPVLHKARSC